MEKFVAIGHVCHDRSQYGFRLGGSAAYTAITAKKLACDSHIVTAVGADFDRQHEKLEGIHVHFTESQETTVFQNVYNSTGDRNQLLLGKAKSLNAQHIPRELHAAELAFVCPIADEIEQDVVDVFSKAVIAVAPQGWMRHWEQDGSVSGKRWEAAEQFLSAAEIVIFSDEDIQHCRDEIKRFIRWTPLVLHTHGSRGATLYEKGKKYDFPAYQVDVVDPTGAGDIFGAAFLIWYFRSGSAYESLKFASCAASFAVESDGTDNIPGLDHIQKRLRSGKTKSL